MGDIRSLFSVLNDAINWFSEHGVFTREEWSEWERKVAEAFDYTMRKTTLSDEMLRRHMGAIFERLVHQGKVVRFHGGVQKFRLANVAPRLRPELEKRIRISADLIKLNRVKAKASTLQRFSGWISSIPVEGLKNVDKRKIKEDFGKPLRQLNFSERRVLIDQGQKLNASISAVLATDGGAIAGRWASNWRQAGYNYREDHKERDGKIFLIRNSWAQRLGLVKPGDAGYSDEITQPGEEVFCSCKFVYLYHIRQLPESMLTEKGKLALKTARAA